MTLANVNIKKVLLKRGNTAQNNNYLGVYGEVSVDMEAKTLRIHDGNTQGGNVITASGVVGSYSNTNAAAYLASQSITSANIGAFQIYANANAAFQTTEINSLRANITAANSAITSLTSNAAVQAALLDTLTGNAATQSQVLDTLTSNASTQATTLSTLLSNAVAQQTSLIDLVSNAATQQNSIADLLANAVTQAQQIANSAGTYTNSNVKSYLSAFDGNLIPNANVTYSLGDATHQWRDLWVSNNTIYIGGIPIRVDGETLLINNLPISSASIIGNLQIDNNNNQLSFGPGESYSFLYMKNDGSETRLANDNGNVQISTIKQGPGGGTHYWTFDDTGNLTISGNINYSNGTSILNGISGGPASSLVNGAYTFNLFANGQSRSPDTVFVSNGVSIIDANGAIQGGMYNSGDADWLNIGASTGRGIKFYVNEEGEGPKFFANGNIQVPGNITAAANVMVIGTGDAKLTLDSFNQAALLQAKKTFNRSFGAGEGASFVYSNVAGTGSITATITNDLYLKTLLERLSSQFSTPTPEFTYSYSNVRVQVYDVTNANVIANVTGVDNYGNPDEYTLLIDQPPTPDPFSVLALDISYDYLNTVGVDVDKDLFGITTDNDDIDIKSGRDIDLQARDDFFVTAGSQFTMTLNANDGQSSTDGIILATQANGTTRSWKYRFDGATEFASGLTAEPLSNYVPVSGTKIIQSANEILELVSTGNSGQTTVGWTEVPNGTANIAAIGFNALVAGGVNITAGNLNFATASTWQFDKTGNLTLPNGTLIRDTGSVGISGIGLGNHGFNIDFGSAVNDWAIMSGANLIQVQPDTAFNISFPEVAQWQFNIDGNLTFPDGTKQITAYTGGGGGGTYGNANVQALLASNVSLIGSSSNITLATLGAGSTTTVSQEGGNPGVSGQGTITGASSNSPGVALVQPGWTVTGNNLVGTTTVTNVSGPDGFGTYTITTDTTEVDPFWYNDVYTFTSNTPSYSNITVSSGNIINAGTYGQINFVANSSGDGYGLSTIQLVPYTAGYDSAYIIIDPTYPNHIHIRAGGEQDNSPASLILGGENSHFQIPSGANSSPYIKSNGYNWQFGTDGTLTFPTGGNLIFDSSATSIIDGVTNITASGTVGANVIQVLSDLTSFGASPAPRIYGFSSIATTGSAVNEGNISASGNLVASRNAYITGDVYAGNIILANGTSIRATAGDAIAIGQNSGASGQGLYAVAVGDRSGVTSQGNLTVAVGSQAGEISQGLQATAVGSGAGNYNQGAGTVAIGTNAGAFNQGLRATAVGSMAGGLNQGEYAVAIGNFAGGSNQANNSIIINATGSSLDQTTANTFTVKPIRNAAGSTVLYYDVSTGEITYDTAGAGSYGNVEVAQYLSNYDGTINFTGSPAVITGLGNITTASAYVSSDLIAGNIKTTNGVFWSNGTNLLSSLASQSYVDTQITNLVNNAPALLDTLGEIAANLATEANAVGSVLNSLTNTNANVTAANLNITALQSNAGSQQTSIDTLLNRVNQEVNNTSSPQFAGLTTTANVELTGNVHIHQNLVVDGNINFIGNVTQTNITTANAVFTGDTYGFGALYAGVLGYTPLPYTVIQATADYNDYSQINFQNLNLSANASTEWVATAGNGTDLTNYIDFGIAGGAWNGTQLNSVGTAAKANDGWVYVLGNTAAGTGGNLVLGTIQPNKRVNILTGGPGSANIYSYFNSSGLTTANVYAANYLYANGVNILTGITGTYSNTNVAGYLAGNITTGNIQVGIAMRINGTTQTIDTANGSSIIIGSRINLTGSAGGYGLSVTHPAQFASNLTVGTNSNAASFYGMNYFYTNGVSILSGIGGTYSNTNVEAYIGGNIGAFQIFSNANSAAQATSINSINANIGAYQIYANANAAAQSITIVSINDNLGSFQTFANANAAAQATGIDTINANIGAFQTYANLTFTGGGGGSTYSNTNVAAYLTTATITTTGNITAANLIATSNVYTSNIITTGATSGNISGANYVSANVVQISSGLVWANGTPFTSGTTYTSSGAGNITVSGSTLALTATGPSAVAVGSSAAIPVITPDGYGRIASLSTAAVVAPAGTLTGTTLAATVVTSSLTTVGTLGSLAVTGNITAGNTSVTQVSATTGVYTSNVTALNFITTGTYGNITNANVISANNVVVSGFGVTMANRPAFRIYGGAPTWFNTGNVNLKGSSIVVDYNQGNYFNSTTGVFTAPVAGLYSVTLNARVGSNNGQNQIIVGKNGLATAGNVAVMWETDTNTGSAIHFGVASTVKLAVGDWLSANITVGNIQFDQNDSWTVTYIG